MQTGIIFTLGKTAVNFYAMGGDDTTVLFNTRLNSLVPACADSWCTPTFANGKLTITATENLTGAPRATEVAIGLGGVSRSITVTQNKAQLVLNRTSISFPRAGSADEVALFLANPDAANIGVDANTIPAEFIHFSFVPELLNVRENGEKR